VTEPETGDATAESGEAPRAADALPAPSPTADPRKEVIRLGRRVERLEQTLRQLEDIRDTNARLLERLRVELDAERTRSLDLLLSVLPPRIVDRLSAGEHPIADRHDRVAVVLGDLVGFTSIAARLPAADLVDRLGALFAAFDAAADRCGVEKIKTVGDAYLAVAGLAPSDEDEPAAAARAAVHAAADLAFAMVDAVAAIGPPWRVRIGLAIGPIAAGVIGTRRYAYDVWGDTVNLASRLEQSSEPGRIHVSEEVATMLDAEFITEPRGPVWLKGMGEVQTWFLLGRRSATGAAPVPAVS
jgi:class 3 adenylate cyclase